MARIDQSAIKGKTRDLPIAPELEHVLLAAAEAAQIDAVHVTSGGQPGSTGERVGSHRHDHGRAADLQLIKDGQTLTFTDSSADPAIVAFVVAAAASGATGIGAGVHYMGTKTLHVGFGRSVDDHEKIVWGAEGRARNAPVWLREAAARGWALPVPRFEPDIYAPRRELSVRRGGSMSRDVFFDGIRDSLFGQGLTREQVTGIEQVLDAWESNYPQSGPRELAYILATVYHETGRKMVPVREGFATSDADAIAAVTRLFHSGKISHNYAEPVNGISYFGRGRVQNTHRANYLKLERRFHHPFVSQPNILIDNPEIDAEVTVVGHVEGIWTGHKLSDYIHGGTCDYVGARRIINGRDKAERIANYAEKFERAIRAAEAAPLVARESPPFLPPMPDIARRDPSFDAYAALFRDLADRMGRRIIDLNPANGSGAPVGAGPAVPAPLGMGSSGAQVRALQTSLRDAGYPLGPVDGEFGTLTRAALLAFQADHNLPTTGAADVATFAALDKAPARPLAQERYAADAKDLRKTGSRVVGNADDVKLTGLLSSILGGLGLSNSAVVEIAKGLGGGNALVAPVNAGVDPQKLVDALQKVVALPANKVANSPDLNQLLGVIREAQSAGLEKVLSPESLPLLKVLKTALSSSGALKNQPLVAQFLDQLPATVSAATPTAKTLNSVFDLLPSFFTEGTLHSLSQGLAMAANSIMPGVGGSIAMLGIGLATRYFANRVIDARVDEHRTATNLNR